MDIAEKNWVWQQKYMTQKSALEFFCQVLEYGGRYSIKDQ